MKDTKQTDSTG